MFRRILSRSRFDERTHMLYDAVAAQARDPDLYGRYGVPDTLDGRFEMLVMHALLAMRRLRDSDEGREASQDLFDLLFADLDRALREVGVGDLGVGRRIRKMAQAFYGRASALDDALADPGGPRALEGMLERNAYGTVEAPRELVAGLAAYVRAQDGHLASVDPRAVCAGRLEFLPVAGIAAAGDHPSGAVPKAG